MADNRMYIRCKICGRGILIAKQFGIVWSERRFDDLNKFFDDHEECAFGSDDPMIYSGENYELCYELSMTDEEDKKIYGKEEE